MKASKILSAEEMQRLDRFAIEEIGIPSAALMENAGCAAAQVVLSMLKGKKNSRVSVFCGMGNNAGDGFVVARHLMNANVSVSVFLIGSPRQLKNDAAINYNILKKCHCRIHISHAVDKEVMKTVFSSDILIDAIFGTGINREVGSPFRDFIECLNQSGKRIVSLDIPSGLNGTTGKIYGTCIRATKTVTFGYAKKGFYQKDGPSLTGEVVVKDIGIPRNAIARFSKKH